MTGYDDVSRKFDGSIVVEGDEEFVKSIRGRYVVCWRAVGVIFLTRVAADWYFG